jgi:Ca2+-transporting ATPase
MRPAWSDGLRNGITRNPYVWGSLGLCLGLLVIAGYWPPLAGVLHLAPPGAAQWGVILAASVLPLLAGLRRRTAAGA